MLFSSSERRCLVLPRENDQMLSTSGSNQNDRGRHRQIYAVETSVVARSPQLWQLVPTAIAESFSAIQDSQRRPRRNSRGRWERRALRRIRPSRANTDSTRREWAKSSATLLDNRMWPPSPQSITRCARLIPAPATFVRVVYVANFIDRPAVNAHPKLQLRILFQLLADLNRAPHGRFGTVEKNERHAVARREAESAFLLLLRMRTCSCTTDNFSQLLLVLTLLIEKQSRITDQIHK